MGDRQPLMPGRGAHRRVQDARRELDEAERVLAEAEAFLVDLQKRLQQAQLREVRLMAITDMLMARDKARRRNAGDDNVDPTQGPQPASGGRRSFLDRLLRR